MGDVSDAPRRDQWWWTAEQLRAAGYRYKGGGGCTMPSLWVNEDAAQCWIAHYDEALGGQGTWRPEPPPDPEMSDEEVRATVKALHSEAPPQNGPAGGVCCWAADVIYAALRRSIARRQRECAERELERLLRRRPQ